MDNLVSIYKSMEVASGVNIRVAQTATLSKLSGNKLVLLATNRRFTAIPNLWVKDLFAVMEVAQSFSYSTEY